MLTTGSSLFTDSFPVKYL